MAVNMIKIPNFIPKFEATRIVLVLIIIMIRVIVFLQSQKLKKTHYYVITHPSHISVFEIYKK